MYCIRDTLMANSGTLRCHILLKVLLVSYLLAVLVTYVVARACPPFSCGDLRNVSYPFHQRGDPAECGVQAYELVCSGSKATIRINTGTYFVTEINYTDSSFIVVDSDLNMHSSCPLPLWNQIPYIDNWPIDSDGNMDLFTVSSISACFVNCSRAITNNSLYHPVTCLSASNSFVYVYIGSSSCSLGRLEPSCGYLAMIPLSYSEWDYLKNASYRDIVVMMREGFRVHFPMYDNPRTNYLIIKTCLNDSISYFHDQISMPGILNKSRAFVWSEIEFLVCVNDYSYRTKLFWHAVAIVSAIDVVKYLTALALLFRFLFVPLALWTFLAHKFWNTKISVDAVEKFLRMQHVLGPTRYAYTDIIAITGHFRDKLGQGGYGEVYKGTLPGDVKVAIKILKGNSSCNGDEFISEVSTIGRIHHVNVVRFMGFCSEEMRRALVYEYMPCGSLDKYIFSAEKSLSWEKLNEIALGIARGMDYLHRGCDMQILHFDIKPHNILLDNSFTPKIADFGLAKLYPRDKSFLPVSAARGTIGYIAPEMISRSFGVISSKADVYSFGMLLLEMAGGRRNADPNAANSSQAYYPSCVYSRLSREENGEITDIADMHELERKLCIVGLWCIQMKPCDRPTMSDVIEMLQGGVASLQMPSRPFFCDDEHTALADSYQFSEMTVISEEDNE